LYFPDAFEPQLPSGEAAIKFMPPLYYQDDAPIALADLPKPFYSSDVFASKLIEYLSQRDKDKPFFAYLPFTAPHWPLQADSSIVAKYKGKYDSGPDALRAARLDALSKLGLVPAGVKPHPVVNSFDTQGWDPLSAADKQYSSRLMETYAAMVEQMDANIGRVVDFLQRAGELEDTFVLFMSDNGAEGALLEALPVMGANIAEVIREHYDNSFDNIGRANSFTWYGPHWAQAGTAPSRMYKAWITEGGIRCPCIIRYPALADGRSISHEFVTVMDILPTVLELAGAQHPGTTFRGRPVLLPRGRSWLPYLLGQTANVHDKKLVTGWELFGQQAIRQGRWKAVFIPKPNGSERWQLYDLDADPAEINDQSSEQVDILNRLLDHWAEYIAETGTVLISPEARAKGPGYGPR
jgi:arylsulfatase A-like enzyme